jgi:hypothetical protein
VRTALLILLALSGAVLYSCVLPVWEGFDEPFHYGYLETLLADHRMPVVKRTFVSQEIRQSLKLLPVSWILHNALPESISFEEWFRLGAGERRARLARLGALPPSLQNQSSDLPNYEAQQAPFAYALLAPFAAAVSHVALRSRVLLLRLLGAIASTALLFCAANLLLDALGVAGWFRIGALACIFESQMVWASVAHIGNDWLAIPLSTLFLALLVRAVRDGSRKHNLLLAAVLVGGLWTKAYSLAFVPVFACLISVRLWRRRMDARTALLAGCIVVLGGAPWYARNIVLYGSLSGTQESIAGVGLERATHGFAHINWISSTIDLFRWSLWTGNWSFVSFSRVTLNIEMILLGAAFVLLFARSRQMSAGEWWALGACFVFFLGLVYQTSITWVATHGEARNAEPWYTQCILPCLWAIAFLSLQRSPPPGRILAMATTAVAAWIAAATYLFKLIPVYGGFTGRATVPAIVAWWRHLPTETLAQTIPGPLALTFASLGIFLLSLALLNFVLLRGLWAGAEQE